MGTPLRVLIIEDSEEDTLLIVRELKRGGFDPIHERVETAEAMKAALSRKTWDLILADYSMPHFSGLEALKLLKESGLDLPFIIVSGSIGEDVAVGAMKSGAHDYLMKNNLTRLTPAIQQELREAEVRRKLKHSEKALQESEKRYRQVVENATEIIYTVDEKGNFTYANASALKVTGYSLMELRSFNYADLVLPEHRERVKEIYVNQLRQRIPTTHVEFPFFSKVSGIIWFSQNASLVIEKGKVVGFHIIARDITERKKAEETLRWSEETGRALLNATTDSVFLIDSSGTILALNEMAGRRLNKRVDEMLGTSLYDFLPPDLAKRRRVRFDEVFRTGKPAYFEDERQGIHFDNCVYPISDVSGKVMKIAIYGRDITERKKAEVALRESEERNRILVETSPDAITLLDLNLNIIMANQPALKLYGHESAEEIKGKNGFDYLALEERGRATEDMRKMLEIGSMGPIEYTLVKKNGTPFPAELKASLVLDAQKKPNGIILVSRDITERKKAEEALRESEEKYRTILETIEEGYYEVDLTGNFTFVNDSLCRMMGYTKDELMGMNNRQYMNEETAEKVYQVFKRLYATGEPYEAFDWEITRKDGTKRFHDSSVSLIRNAKGECIGFRGIARDITERKQAEERLRLQGAALEAAANAIIITDHEGMIEWANPAFTMLTGYSHTEAVSRNPRQLIKSGEQNQAFYKNLWDTILAGKVWRGQIINRRKDGSLYTEEMTITPLRNERGEISRFIAIKQDITERKRAEETLHESEERFKELYDDAPVGYHEYDSEGRITRVNRTDLEMLGYTREEMVGHYIWEFNLDEEVVRQQVMEKLAGSRPPGQALERIYKRKDGTTFPVLIEDRLIPDGNGRISGIRCTIQDITDRKRAEENLKQSEENARQLAKENAVMAEIGRIISSTLDIDEVYGSFSEEVKKIIPFDRVLINIINIEKRTVRNVYIAGKELQDRNVKDVYPLEGSGNAEMVRTKSTLLIQTEDFNEYKNRFPMLLSTFQAGFRSIMNVPLFSKGKIIGGLLLRSHKPHAYTDRDVRLAERVASQIAGAVANAQLYAERIEAEKEREALQEQLRQSQKMEAIGQLAGGVAHDFNNILTVIKGYSQLSLTEMKEGDPFRGNVEEIRKASDRAADLTRQLLAFSRRQIMEMRVLDLNRLLQNLDKMLRRLIGEDIGLVTLLAEDLGRVKADPGQIEQMVMNLVVNARDAMLNGGKLTIETANVELDQAYARAHIAVKPGPYVMVSVSDTGVGMAPEVRDRVFEPFFTTKEKGKGTGLGLSTVYGIVKQSGGNIWVYSEPGKGTTFKIYLPCVEEPLEALKEKIMAGELPRGSETILIVEDEKEVLKLAGTILRRQGYHVVEAVSGEEALKVCKERKEPFHLLLTDVVMPQMSGRQLAEQLKQLCRNFRVLYMSGYTDNAITHHGVLDKGMNYLQKPFTVDALARKVREVLDK
jgi:PAS domain S-box-containing protein